MYTYVKSVCLGRSAGSRWMEVDISDNLVFDIFNNYSKVYLELSNPFLESNVFVDLDILRFEFSNYSETLTNLLIFIDNRALATVPALPNTTLLTARYSDAFRAKYKINLTTIGVSVPDNYPVSDKHDLKIDRPQFETDLSLLHTHCLVSVNGYYHMTDTDDISAFVYDGGRTMRQSRNNQLGILSFLDIGKLTKERLKVANIHAQHDTSTLMEKIYFSVDADLDDKSYILVLGGYLVFADGSTFYRVGDNSFALDLNKIPYIERIYESMLYMDMSHLQLTQSNINEEAINYEEAISDRVIKNYLTLSQTFLAVVDIPNLITNKHSIRKSNLPGMFTAYQDPIYPLIVNYGKVAEYWKTFEDGHWAVNVLDSYLRNYVLSTQPKYMHGVVNNNLLSENPFRHSKANLLEIRGYH